MERDDQLVYVNVEPSPVGGGELPDSNKAYGIEEQNGKYVVKNYDFRGYSQEYHSVAEAKEDLTRIIKNVADSLKSSYEDPEMENIDLINVYFRWAEIDLSDIVRELNQYDQYIYADEI